ncbi:tripartite tricarboxylate transporter substrate binding protein [Bradyrhizobium lablabi]|nr:tripartite tricarboxylate transporter substrate binding protein [Bradyrhizobium lablabi]
MTTAASAQSYPSRPIRLVVGFPPGGINDLVARIIGQSVSDSLGQPIVVENRPGAGGTIGAAAVAKADPDGYTLLLASVSNLAMAPSQYKNLPYDPNKDFAPVALVAASPNILVVPNDSTIRTVPDLIALAKKQPGTLNYGSAGNGTSNHLTVELLKTMAGIDLVHVPYRGDAPGMTDVLAGRIQMMFPTLPVALPQIKAGAVRAIAVSSPKRSELVPEIPTVAESASMPEFSVSVWVGILAPAGTSPEIVSKLNAEINKALASSTVREQLAVQGTEPAAAGDPKAFAAYLAAETKKWSEVAKAAGIVPN